jgi:murein DD-endopeptidase MepM/ murein hydrolase activator NlpD
MGVRLKALWIVAVLLFGEALMIAGIHYGMIQKSRTYDRYRQDTSTTQNVIAKEMIYFPVARAFYNEVTYEDSYGAARQNGGHEGCDIMDVQNEPGRIPVVSATDGVITNLGWLYLGGYRIGITSESGIYYYYAHLDSYGAGLAVGDEVKAGQFLGFMGNTGEGEEGTKGKFDVHLHFGIYIWDENREETVNPYPFLRDIDEK